MLDVTQYDPGSINILLLKGGTSGERDISLSSAAGVAEALRQEGYNVTEVDTGADGYLHAIADASVDVVFICLHGRYGEDGTIQGLCELLGKPYVGPGVLASALAADKARTKTFYIASGIPTPNSITLRRDEPYDLDDIIAAVGEMSVVKPSTEGSSIGITIVHNPSELAAALEEAFRHDSVAVIERFVEGVEVTVGVLGNENPVALPVIEIVPANEFYDLESKYAQGGAQHIIPARISDDLLEACKRIAINAHEALGCKGVSRTDLIIDTTGTCWAIETNTIPGMTPTSLLPDAAKVAGIAYPKLCRLMVDLAIDAATPVMERQATIKP